MKFRSIALRECSCGQTLYDVVYQDGTRETLHYGSWPNRLTDAQRDQLREATADSRIRPAAPSEGGES